MSIADSIRQRLLNLSKSRNETFDLVLTKYGLERLLFRIGESEWKEKLFLKGALLFSVWHDLPYRSTRDLDLLGYGFSSLEYIKNIFVSLCQLNYPEDGLVFNPESINCREIRENNKYNGIRVKLTAFLAEAKIPLQVDIGFGDKVTPEPQYITFPTLLPLPAPHIYAYTIYSVVAEKFNAMVVLGILNSRLKDFFDIWMLSQTLNFSGTILCSAIRDTFKRRDCEIPNNIPIALTDDFSKSQINKIQWKAFLNKKNVNIEHMNFPVIIEQLKQFLLLPLQSIQKQKELKMTWRPEEGWIE